MRKRIASVAIAWLLLCAWRAAFAQGNLDAIAFLQKPSTPLLGDHVPANAIRLKAGLPSLRVENATPLAVPGVQAQQFSQLANYAIGATEIWPSLERDSVFPNATAPFQVVPEPNISILAAVAASGFALARQLRKRPRQG